MLQRHAFLAMSMGMAEDHAIILEPGQALELSEDEASITGPIPTGAIMVDGLGVGDVGNVVLRDRKHLSQDGLIIVVVGVSKETGQLVSGPELISRGFVFVKESDTLLEDARRVVERTVDFIDFSDGKDLNAAKNKIRDALSRYIYQITRKSPMILPVIMEV
jgi:ribonuclease J